MADHRGGNNPRAARIWSGRTTSDQSLHYNDVIMSAMASQITGVSIVCSTVGFRRRSKKTPKLRVTGPCAGTSPVTGEFLTQKANNAENVSIWWRHHEFVKKKLGSMGLLMQMSQIGDQELSKQMMNSHQSHYREHTSMKNISTIFVDEIALKLWCT